MRSIAFVALAAACASASTNRATVVIEPVAADAGVAQSTDAAPTPTLQSEADLARAVVDRWNDAHKHHDAIALSAIYAPNVLFYATDGTTAKLPRAECVKRKAAAFASAPDYDQSIRDVKIVLDGNGGAFVEMTKVSTSRGKSTSYDSYVYVDDGLVAAEGDGKETPTLRWNWCVHDVPFGNEEFLGFPRDEAIGGFKVSPLDAVRAALRTERADALRRRTHGARVKAVIKQCPQLCANFDPRGPMADPPCENKTGEYTLVIYDPAGGEVTDEVKIDAMK